MTPTNPFEDYQYVDVEFETVDRDTRVPHSLSPLSPYDVTYLVVRRNCDCTIYDGQFGPSANHDPWTRSYITVRSNAVPARVTLLLTLKKNPTR